MFKYIFAMIIPTLIFIYTLSFAKWMARKHDIAAATSAGILAVVVIVLSGAALWRIIA